MRSSGTRVPSRAHLRSNTRCYNSVSGNKLKPKRSSGTRVPSRAHPLSNARCYNRQFENLSARAECEFRDERRRSNTRCYHR
ncbi:hypothetical protein NDU88_005511 [Pleurodeles waltl]|uniref:Uncharacterized protein n=1 Tax=Pleurodeles waltl TaxID=8319 RepID=A0AAV7M9J3_PLEWA|nr:hypothetical protein NDU88_005511 [Pleurodeles waltl]